MDTAKLLGYGNDKLRHFEEILERAKTVDDALIKFKKLKEEPNNSNQNNSHRNNSVKIIQGENNLLKHLENGWTLLKELNHDKYLFKQ